MRGKYSKLCYNSNRDKSYTRGDSERVSKRYKGTWRQHQCTVNSCSLWTRCFKLCSVVLKKTRDKAWNILPKQYISWLAKHVFSSDFADAVIRDENGPTPPLAPCLSSRGSCSENNPSHSHKHFIFLVCSFAFWKRLSYQPWWWLWGFCSAPPPRGLVNCELCCLYASIRFSDHRCVMCFLTSRDHCAQRVTRWGWQRRPATSMAPQLQPSSLKWSTKASLQISFMKMRR